jgi:hypothetical protein
MGVNSTDLTVRELTIERRDSCVLPPTVVNSQLKENRYSARLLGIIETAGPSFQRRAAKISVIRGTTVRGGKTYPRHIVSAGPIECENIELN